MYVAKNLSTQIKRYRTGYEKTENNATRKMITTKKY